VGAAQWAWFGFPCGEKRGREEEQRAEGVVTVLVGGRTTVWNRVDSGLASAITHVGSGRGGVACPGRFGLGGVRVSLALPGDR
jgi:hypothetical protein